MVEVTPISGFAYWFPGWFWEMATIVAAVFSISMSLILFDGFLFVQIQI